MMKYRTPANYKLKKADMETPKGRSLTEKGQSYSIRQLFDKAARGLQVGQYRPGEYHDTEDFDAIDFEKASKSDLFEREQISSDVVAKMEAAKAAKEKSQKTRVPEQGKEPAKAKREQGDEPGESTKVE